MRKGSTRRKGSKYEERVLAEYRTMHNIPTQSSEVRTPVCPDFSRGIAFQPLPCARPDLSESTLNHNYTLACCRRCWQKTVANVPITGILRADGAVDGLVCDKTPVTMALSCIPTSYRDSISGEGKSHARDCLFKRPARALIRNKPNSHSR
jgi:hypothetical protein